MGDQEESGRPATDSAQRQEQGRAHDEAALAPPGGQRPHPGRGGPVGEGRNGRAEGAEETPADDEEADEGHGKAEAEPLDPGPVL